MLRERGALSSHLARMRTVGCGDSSRVEERVEADLACP